MKLRKRNALIAELYRQGEKLEAIGARFGITRQRPLQIAQNHGETLRGRGAKLPPKPKKIGRLGNIEHEARNVVVLELYAWGFKPRYICGITGLSRGRVQGILDRFATQRHGCSA